MNPAIEHRAVFQLLFRYPFSSKGEFFGLDEVLKDQELEFNDGMGLSIINFLDGHSFRRGLIVLVRDLDVVTVQMRIVDSEGSPADIIGWESNEGFP